MLNKWCNNISKSQMVAFLYVFPLFSVNGWLGSPPLFGISIKVLEADML